MAKKNNKKSSLPEGVFQVEIKWASDEGLETIYVNHMKVTHGGPEFYLLFGELPWPIVLTGDEIPSDLTVIPKVRLAISPAQMKSFADALSVNVANYTEKREAIKDDDND